MSLQYVEETLIEPINAIILYKQGSLFSFQQCVINHIQAKINFHQLEVLKALHNCSQTVFQQRTQSVCLFCPSHMVSYSLHHLFSLIPNETLSSLSYSPWHCTKQSLYIIIVLIRNFVYIMYAIIKMYYSIFSTDQSYPLNKAKPKKMQLYSKQTY